MFKSLLIAAKIFFLYALTTANYSSFSVHQLFESYTLLILAYHGDEVNGTCETFCSGVND